MENIKLIGKSKELRELIYEFEKDNVDDLPYAFLDWADGVNPILTNGDLLDYLDGFMWGVLASYRGTDNEELAENATYEELLRLLRMVWIAISKLDNDKYQKAHRIDKAIKELEKANADTHQEGNK